MNKLKFLMSPYLIELPMRCLDNKLNKVPEDRRVTSVLLLDVLTNTVYLIDEALLPHDDWDETKHYPLGWSSAEKDGYFRKHNYCGIEIEINSHCNHKCSFCPVSYNSQLIRFMSLSKYEHIISEAISCNIKNVSLNHYSEPTLHPDLVRIIGISVERGLNISLFTNGSNLTCDMVNEISKFSNTLEVVVNFPECTEDDYCRVTKSTQFKVIISQINYAKTLLPIKVAVNNSTPDKLKKMSILFPDVTIQSWDTDDRAGKLMNGKHQTHMSQTLNGCPLAARFVNISIDGDVFLCAQDFDKHNVFGNINKKPLLEILGGAKAKQYRKWIFGENSPSKGFICRHCSWTKDKTARFSLGRNLSEYDIDVYSDIVQKGAINIVTKTNDGVQYFEFNA